MKDDSTILYKMEKETDYKEENILSIAGHEGKKEVAK